MEIARARTSLPGGSERKVASMACKTNMSETLSRPPRKCRGRVLGGVQTIRVLNLTPMTSSQVVPFLDHSNGRLSGRPNCADLVHGAFCLSVRLR